jgi:cytochrome bd-type quinol oxidase subunit 2
MRKGSLLINGVLPVVAAYTIGVYWVFRGKAGESYD